jgi:hypothetical protein
MAATVIRLNKDDPNLHILLIDSRKVKISTSYGQYVLLHEDVFWFRRAGSYSIFRTQEKNDEKLQIKSFNFMEAQSVWQSLLYWALENGNCLDNPFNADVNKTNVLQLASKTGLLIPDWILAGTRAEVAMFLNGKEKLAAKPFTSLLYIKGKRSVKLLTGCIDKKSIENIPDI